jgi:hypothetical protein
MAKSSMPTLMTILTTHIGRAVRSYKRAAIATTEKERNFHAGQYEAHLQAIALINGCEVKDIRQAVLGATAE